jgi:KaiC/GvpD/RAD55 family RecA-like ATPase
MTNVDTLERPETTTFVEDIKELSWIEELWGEGADDDIMDIDNVPKPDWLVEGIVVRQGLTLIYGESQIGKTTFCLHLIDALQRGETFFGRYCQKAKVLLAEQDQSPPMLRSQKEKLGRPERLGIINKEVRWDNKTKVFAPYLEKTILEIYEPDVVIIDAYTSLGIEDINHPSASLSFDALRTFSKRYNCAFVLTHHTTKGGTQMGSNLNTAKMDSVIALKRKNENKKKGDEVEDSGGIIEVKVKQEKLKADRCEDIDLIFNTNTLKMTRTKTTKEYVKELKAQGESVDKVIQLLELDGHGVKRDTIKRYYREC